MMNAGISWVGVDVGGTFTKLALGAANRPARFPTPLLWAHAGLRRERLLAELRHLALDVGAAPPLTLDGGGAFLLAYAGEPKGDAFVLAHAKSWGERAGVPREAVRDLVHLQRDLALREGRYLAMVDKHASAFSFISRNPGRDGAALTLGTGVGLMGIVQRRHEPSITSRNVKVASRRAGRQLNLHELLGGAHIHTLAAGEASDIRATVSDRLVRAALAVEARLLDAGAHAPLIEVAGGNSRLIVSPAAVAREFDSRRRDRGSELRWLNDPDGMNNIEGLVAAWRLGLRGHWTP